MRGLLVAALTLVGAPVAAQQFVPPIGYSGRAQQAPVAPDPEPGTPALTAIPAASLAGRFRIDPGYARADRAHVGIVGAYAVAERPGARLVDAWAPGFLPVTLAYSDGRCFTLSAAYVGGVLSGARLAPASCEGRRSYELKGPPAAPAGLRPLGAPWGFGTWVDARAGQTVIGAPWAKTFTPLLRARFPAMAVMAMNSPDAPGANLTFVGMLDGRTTVVTIDLSY